MRILGGHDYYDSAMAFGQDRETVFVRHKNKKIKIKDFMFDLIKPKVKDYERAQPFDIVRKDGKEEIWYNRNRPFVHDSFKYLINYEYVYFCGKRYNGIRLSKVDTKILNPIKYKDSYFWDIDIFIQFLDSIGFEIKGATKNPKWRSWRYKTTSLEETKLYFNPIQNNDAFEWLVQNRITIAQYISKNTIEDGRNKDVSYWLIDGDKLSDIQFYKIVDAYKAFQEISMWIGNVIPKSGGIVNINKKVKPPKVGGPMVEISNDVKIHKAGFDKFSFRKGKSK